MHSTQPQRRNSEQMKTIHKYVIPKTPGLHTIEAPDDAEWLHTVNQNEELCVWAIVDTDEPLIQHHLLVLWTGEPAPDEINDLEHLGTDLFAGDALVTHTFLVER